MAAVYRGVLAACALAGIVFLLVHTGDPGTFVYFTVQSNALVAVVFGLAAVRPVRPWLRGAATLYIVITGTVYHLVLVNPASPFAVVDAGAGTVHNLLLHTVTPILAAIDWLVVSREPMRWRWAALWLVYPLAYLAFALTRGAIVDRYPYPFVDANELGYDGVAVSALFFAGAFYLLGLGLIGLGALARRITARTAAPA